MMQRRQVLAAAAGLPPLGVRAQAQDRAQGKLPVIGILLGASAPSPEAAAKNPLIVRLRELGWEQGRTVRFEVAYAEEHEERLPALAAALVAKKVDLIYTAGTRGVFAARQATDTIPIVARGPDLLALGLVQSLARPGGNVTGLPNEAGRGVLAKRLELLKRAAPSARRVAYLRNRRPAGHEAVGAEVTDAAQALGLELSVAEVDGQQDLEAAFAAFARRKPDALWCADSRANYMLRKPIFAFAQRERLPVIYSNRQMTEAGGLMSYSVNFVAINRRAAEYIDKILRGARAADLPVELPTRFELVINLKTARMQGIKMPQDLLLQADEVIQ